jgi:hypothetical protein
MNTHSFAHFQAIHDAQLPPDRPPYREPTEAEIVEQTERVLKRWQYDEARFVETVAEVICKASPSEQAHLQTMAEAGNTQTFGDAVIKLWREKWRKDARVRAEDELAGLV